MSMFFEGPLIVGGVIIGVAAAILIASAVAKIMVWIDEKGDA